VSRSAAVRVNVIKPVLALCGREKELPEVSHISLTHRADVARMAELAERYADLGLGGTDASLVALAERLGLTTLATFDRRHFTVVRPAHTPSFTLLPA